MTRRHEHDTEPVYDPDEVRAEVERTAQCRREATRHRTRYEAERFRESVRQVISESPRGTAVPDIAAQMQIPARDIYAAISRLSTDGRIEEAGLATGIGGRRRTLWRTT